MRHLKILTAILIFSSLTFIIYGYLMPLELTLAFHQKCFFKKNSLLNVQVELQPKNYLQVLANGERIYLIPQEIGEAKANVVLFQTLKIKEIKVKVVSEEKVIALGQAVGLRLHLEGLLVEALTGVDGADGIHYNPLKDLGLKKGDMLVEANGVLLKKTEDLILQVEQSFGRAVELKYRRQDQILSISVLPVWATDEKYHLGMWVRDMINGIGTLTFYREDTGEFGALGHGISGEEESHILPIQGGETFQTEISYIKKGVKGIPGELKGNLMIDYQVIGKIENNTKYGIFGRLSHAFIHPSLGDAYPLGYKEYAKEGKAQILSTIDGKKVEAFLVEIQKIVSRPFGDPKGMIVKIIDPKLIEKTGGIVQGMSGSPIIQNQRLIGAVTHVLVNDPHKGYGVFIENMLEAMR